MGWQRGEVKPVRLKDRWDAGRPTVKELSEWGAFPIGWGHIWQADSQLDLWDPVRLKDVKAAHES